MRLCLRVGAVGVMVLGAMTVGSASGQTSARVRPLDRSVFMDTATTRFYDDAGLLRLQNVLGGSTVRFDAVGKTPLSKLDRTVQLPVDDLATKVIQDQQIRFNLNLSFNPASFFDDLEINGHVRVRVALRRSASGVRVALGGSVFKLDRFVFGDFSVALPSGLAADDVLEVRFVFRSESKLPAGGGGSIGVSCAADEVLTPRLGADSVASAAQRARLIPERDQVGASSDREYDSDGGLESRNIGVRRSLSFRTRGKAALAELGRVAVVPVGDLPTTDLQGDDLTFGTSIGLFNVPDLKGKVRVKVALRRASGGAREVLGSAQFELRSFVFGQIPVPRPLDLAPGDVFEVTTVFKTDTKTPDGVSLSLASFWDLDERPI